MKEATGELNMTVITVVAIAAVAAIFYAFIWPSIQGTMIAGTACTQTGGQTANYTEGQYEVNCGGGECTVTKGTNTYKKVCDNVNKQ